MSEINVNQVLFNASRDVQVTDIPIVIQAKNPEKRHSIIVETITNDRDSWINGGGVIIGSEDDVSSAILGLELRKIPYQLIDIGDPDCKVQIDSNNINVYVGKTLGQVDTFLYENGNKIKNDLSEFCLKNKSRELLKFVVLTGFEFLPKGFSEEMGSKLRHSIKFFILTSHNSADIQLKSLFLEDEGIIDEWINMLNNCAKIIEISSYFLLENLGKSAYSVLK